MIRHVCLLYIGSVQREEISDSFTLQRRIFSAIEAGGSETSNVTGFSDIKNDIHFLKPNSYSISAHNFYLTLLSCH